MFVCSHNAGRSQMAATLLAHRAGDRVTVSSAGTTLSGEVERGVAQALVEAGIDLADAYPEPLTDEVVQAADIVTTMGCGDACPIFPGKKYLDWALEDPAGRQGVEAMRPIRDEIKTRVEALIAEIDAQQNA
ncbi:arsenate reductase ArsC [Streptomyces sp. NPDC055060]